MKKTISLFAFSLALILMSFKAAGPNGYTIGDTAQDFSLKNVDGKMVSLASFEKANGYIVVFTCNNCPYAQAYENRIVKLHEKYAPLGFPVVAINSNDPDIVPADSYENMQERAKANNLPYVYLHDATQEVAKAYGATRTPHVFLLDNKRIVRYIGAIDDNTEDETLAKEKYVENAVEAMLAGKEITVTQTKAIGCGIKWKKS